MFIDRLKYKIEVLKIHNNDINNNLLAIDKIKHK